jgi:hypothetical protein
MGLSKCTWNHSEREGPKFTTGSHHGARTRSASDDKAGCGGFGYDGDGVEKKIPAKRDAPINLMRNMAYKFFNWECTLPFNTAPRSEENLTLNIFALNLNTTLLLFIREKYFVLIVVWCLKGKKYCSFLSFFKLSRIFKIIRMNYNHD